MRCPFFAESGTQGVTGLRLGLALALVLGAGCATRQPAFFPLGIYSASHTGDLEAIREAGFTVVKGPAERKFLEAAQRLGLKVLAYPGTAAGADFDAEKARRVVRAYDRHPALWGWYLSDEPDLNGVAPEDIRLAHRFLKRLGARKPTALVIYQGREALFFGHLTDVFMVDRYPIGWLPLANFGQHVRSARLALGPEKPLVAVIQAFDWSYYPELMPAAETLRPPTVAELRCMTYQALVCRANGLFYYCYDDGRWRMKDHPEVWDALKQVLDEVRANQPLFQGEHVQWFHLHEFPDDPKRGFNEALESSVSPAWLRVKWGNAKWAQGDYIVAVNSTAESHRYRLKVPRGGERLRVHGEERELRAEEGWIEDTFAPYAVHIYGPLQGNGPVQ